MSPAGRGFKGWVLTCPPLAGDSRGVFLHVPRWRGTQGVDFSYPLTEIAFFNNSITIVRLIPP